MKRKVKESCDKNKPLQQKTQWASQVKYGCETSKIYVMYFIIQNEILNVYWQLLHGLLNESEGDKWLRFLQVCPWELSAFL